MNQTSEGEHIRRKTAPTSAVQTPMAAHFASHSAPGSGFAVLLNDVQSAAFLGVSVRKFHDLRAESWMPRAVVLGPRLLRWSRSELEQAVLGMPRQAEPGHEPAQLHRARRAKIDAMKKRGGL